MFLQKWGSCHTPEACCSDEVSVSAFTDGEAEPEAAGVAAEEEEEEEEDIGAEQLAQKQGAQLARRGITFNAKGGQVCVCVCVPQVQWTVTVRHEQLLRA